MRATATVQISTFKADWSNGLMISEICQRHTLSRDQVVRLRIRLELPPRMDRGRRSRAAQGVPTQEQIAERAAAIRLDWTPEIERKRRGLDAEQFYEIPRDVETPEDFDPKWYE